MLLCTHKEQGGHNEHKWYFQLETIQEAMTYSRMEDLQYVAGRVIKVSALIYYYTVTTASIRWNKDTVAVFTHFGLQIYWRYDLEQFKWENNRPCCRDDLQFR